MSIETEYFQLFKDCLIYGFVTGAFLLVLSRVFNRS